MNFIKIQRVIILVAILLTPVFSAAELYEILQGGGKNVGVAVSPIYVKALKDVALVLLVLLGVVIAIRRGRIFSNAPLYLFFFAALLAIIASVRAVPPVIILAGLRYLLPLVAVLFIWRAIDDSLQIKIAKLLHLLLLGAVALQLLQMVFLPPVWGVGFMGLNLRNPGYFIVPQTMAAFACFTAYYIYTFLQRTIWRRFVIFGITPLSVALTASAGGLAALVSLYFVWFYFAIKERYVPVYMFVFAVAVLILTLPTLVGRENIYVSLQERIRIFQSALTISDIVASTKFGIATNTGVTLLKTFDYVDLGSGAEDVLIVDSTITSLSINIGLVSISLFLLAWFSISSYTRQYVGFIAIFMVFVLVKVIFEAFPLNLLMAVNFIYLQSLRLRIRAENTPATVANSAPSPTGSGATTSIMAGGQA